MRQISIRVSLRRHAFVHLHYMYFPPRHFLTRERAHHDPGRAATANGHHKTTARLDSLASFCCNHSRSRSGGGLVIRKDFYLH
jgi:hypothetical protein